MAALKKSTGISKVLRFLLKGFLLLIILSILAVAAPRIWSVLNPDKPPVGYHFMAPAYIALWTGLEKLVNTTPQDVTATLSYRLLNDGPYPACAEAVVDIYGPADLTTEYARNHALVTSLIARSYEDSPGLYAEASPVNYLDKNDPPTLILHGTSDRLVPIGQSDDLKEKLDSLGVPCEYYRLPLWPHTMDIVKRVNDYCQVKMTEFFERYMK